MDADRWQRLQTLFDDALALPEAEREAFLRSGCRTEDGAFDEALYREAASLLAVETPSVLEGLALDVGGLDLDGLGEDDESRLGETVGPYRIERSIGRGGMGAVYLAARSDGQFEQQVALKLVRSGLHSNAVLRRFQRERQILARLQHPAIARLLGGGVTDDGRPYFAMEYVEGEPIVAYCDRHALPLGARIALFRQVCDAVQYAHRQLVVHRDLKPSNVLVAETEGPSGRPVPQVKLLDFGIATVLHGEGADGQETGGPAAPETVLTRTGQFVLTPEYAAPEQVRGEAVTTATDVYALGVLLYELLTGRRPYTFDKRTPGVIEHVVGSVEPPRPSTAVGTAVRDAIEDSNTTEVHFGTPTERLRRQLRGDLDQICLVALRKEPERRYASAAALGDDLRRHAEGLPVEARPDTAGYRIRRFVGRHRAGVAAALLAVLAVALVTAVAFARVQGERDRAQVQAAKAEQVSSFLVELFAEGDPSQAQGDSALVVDVLDRGAERARRELADQPEVQTTLLQTIGGVYAALGIYRKAQDALLDALHREERRPRPDPLRLIETTAALGDLYTATGRYREADSLYERSLTLRRALPASDPDRDVYVGHALMSRATLRYTTGAYPEAESLATVAQRHFERAPQAEPLYLASVASLLSGMATDDGDTRTADSLNLRVLELRRAGLSAPHVDIARALLAVGRTKRYLEEYGAAEQYYEEALAMNEELFGERHAETAYVLNHLSSLAFNQERYDEAERYARQGLDIRREVYGDVHVEVGSSLGNLARVLERKGEADDARAVLAEMQTLLAHTVGEDHPFYGSILSRIARLDARQGRLRSAERGYRDALGVMRNVWPDGHFRIAEVIVNFATLLSPGDTAALLEEAEQSCRTAPDREAACLAQVGDARAALAER